ncbi:DUF6767 domain-containing protein [Corynebacterium uropygiale]|uniref:DUF6767 domain-containing protein n=1 Tax=Corynebacterium uropygiale TaxID=1775911 RepID=UPI00308436B0
MVSREGWQGQTPRKSRTRRTPQPRCPIRYGEPCTACQPGTSGPEDCQLVALVMDDPDLRERMQQMNREHRQRDRDRRRHP